MKDETNHKELEPELEPERSLRRETFGKLMRINRLSMGMHHRRMSEGGPLGDPLRGRGRVIALLQLKDGVATRDIAHVLGVRVSSLNEVIARLERDGLVERKPNQDDRRQVLVFLTEEGKKQKMRESHLHDKVFAEFSDEEVEQFGGYLDRVAGVMERELGEMPERGERRGGPHGHGHQGPHGKRPWHGEPFDPYKVERHG